MNQSLDFAFTEEFKKDTQEFWDRSKALLDAGDVLGWAKLMADDEQKMLEKFGLGAPAPFRMVAGEIEQLRALVSDCYVYLVGYNPETHEGPPDAQSRPWLVHRCLKVMAAARASGPPNNAPIEPTKPTE